MNLIYSNPRFQAWGKDNYFLAYGRLYIYDAGTENLKDIFDKDDNPVANPLILDSQGKVVDNGIRTEVGNYRLVWQKRLGTNNYTTVDDVDNIPNDDAVTPDTDSNFVDTMVDLRALPVPAEQVSVFLSRYYDDTYTGGGPFIWDVNATGSDDNGFMIQPGSLPATGRWRRSLESTDINPWMTGCREGEDTFDNQTRLAQLNTFANLNKEYRVVIPEGKWYTSGNLTFNCHVRFERNANFAIETLPGSPYTLTFGDYATIDIPYNTNLVTGGYYYKLVIADGCKNVNDYVSLQWTIPEALAVAGTSVVNFFDNINNTFGGVVLNTSVNANGAALTVAAASTGFILQEGAELDVEGTLQLPLFIKDERLVKTPVISMGLAYHSNKKRELPLSAFKGDKTTVDALMGSTAAITATLRIVIDTDWVFAGDGSLVTNEAVTLVPQSGIITNAGTFGFTVSCPVENTRSRWLDPSVDDYITVVNQDIKLSWFLDDNLGSTLSHVLAWGEYVDLEQNTVTLNASTTYDNRIVKVKNGTIRCGPSCSLLVFQNCENFRLDRAEIVMDNATGNTQVSYRAGSINDLSIKSCDLSSVYRFKISALTHVTGDLQVSDTEFNEFQWLSGINPLDSDNVYPYFNKDSHRFFKDNTYNGPVYFETPVWMRMSGNHYSDLTTFETPKGITVEGNEVASASMHLYGGAINAAWYLEGVSFRNNRWFEAVGNITHTNIELYKNAENSIFEGNYCISNDTYGILNNRRHFTEDIEVLSTELGGIIWSGFQNTLYTAIAGNRHYMALGRANTLYQSGSSIFEAMNKQVSVLQRSAVRLTEDGGSTWTDWGVFAVDSNGGSYHAPSNGDLLAVSVPPAQGESDVDGNGDYSLFYVLQAIGTTLGVPATPLPAIQARFRIMWYAEV